MGSLEEGVEGLEGYEGRGGENVGFEGEGWGLGFLGWSVSVMRMTLDCVI